MSANPQKENGYTAIANEILEALCKIRISGEAMQALNVVFRKTYGFNKREDRIALSQFVEITGLKKQTVCKALNKLKEMNLIIVTKKGNDNIYGFNKDHEAWKPLPKKVTSKGSAIKRNITKKDNDDSLPKKVKIVTKKGEASLPKKIHTKETTTKDNTKDIREGEVGAKAPTPKDKAQIFFDGVYDLVEKKPVPWLSDLLSGMAEKNKVPKRDLWDEIKAFCSYWTELNHTGTRRKWQLQKTFEVNLRLATWFRRAGHSGFSAAGQSKGRQFIGLENEDDSNSI